MGFASHPRSKIRSFRHRPKQTLFSSLSSLSTNSRLNILGLGFGFPGYTVQAVVPDNSIAVGPTEFVQRINESFAVFNKSNGSLAYSPANGNTLWQPIGGPCATYNNLDSIVQSDRLANRWIMMMPIVHQPSYLCVAVSTAAEFVNSAWNLYACLEPTRRCAAAVGQYRTIPSGRYGRMVTTLLTVREVHPRYLSERRPVL